MRAATWLLFVSTGLLVSGEPVDQGFSKIDATPLQGTWAIVSIELEGLPLPMDHLRGARLTVQGQRYSFRLDGTELEFSCSLDAAKEPATIDLKIADGLDKGKVFRGIYKIDQDRYTICRGFMPDQDRPTAFATWPDSGFVMIVWERVLLSASR